MTQDCPNFTWRAVHLDGDVLRTSLPVDGLYVFASFREARTALTGHFREMASAYSQAASQACRLRVWDVQDPLPAPDGCE